MEVAIGSPAAIAASDLPQIQAIVSLATKVDLRHYRMELAREAVARRMALRRMEHSAEYVPYLREHSREAWDLFEELRPSPDHFFQERDTFEALRAGFDGSLFKDRQPGEKVRAWVPCCGNGAAAYSVAMALTEMLHQIGLHVAVQVFGTDIDERALEMARGGVFSEALLSGVSEPQRTRFFTHAGDAYQIRREARDLCLFARHNIASDPPLGRMDLVVFQNQLEPLTDPVRNRVLERLHFSLKANGVLALGQSGLPETAAPWFAPVSRLRGVFLRVPGEYRTPFRWNGPAHRDGASTAETLPLEDLNPAAPDGREPASAEPLSLSHVMAGDDTRGAHEHFRALLEEQSRAIESLRLANEEVICSNEELQVTNAELTAAREGLEAAHQELAALYDEMQYRNRSLTDRTAELVTLFRSMDVAVVTVDSALHVRHFTPKAARLFSLSAGDQGRRLTDLQPKLIIPELEAILKVVVENRTLHECEAQMVNGATYRLSIRPYQNEDGRIDGAILTAWPLAENRA